MASVAPLPDPILGVAASPLVIAAGEPVPSGGGRYQVGKPYQIAGDWYAPAENPGYDDTGSASWYGAAFHGRVTANGEIFDRTALTAAHPTLPLPSYVRVTNLDNDRSIMVRVNDRGPYSHKRLIDVSERTAELLGFRRDGVAPVRVQYVERAPIEGGDEAFLAASYRVDKRAAELGRVMLAAAERAAPAAAAPDEAPVAVAAQSGASDPPATIAFAESTAEPAPAAAAAETISSPYSADQRILMAFETASLMPPQ